MNFIWGAANLLTGLTILVRHPVTLGANLDCLAMAVGALLLGSYLSRRFGKVRAQRQSAA